MRRLVITHAARRDLKEIAEHTESTWGSAQKRAYLSQIRQKLQSLRESPGLGTSRPEVRDGCRSLGSGRHQIFYREARTAVIVLRVLHDRMNVHRHLGQEEL